MKRSLVILTAVLALVAATTAVALAGSDRGAEKQDIVQIFESNGDASNEPYDAVGTAKLIRRDDGLKATAQISGLIPGGVYTFWWLVGPPGFDFVGSGGDDIPLTFVASGGGKVVGKNGKATVRMNTEFGQTGIEGFLESLTGMPETPTAPFHETFDMDPMTAGVHIEVAYHGQASDAGDELQTWLSDFWTGTSCPAVGTQAANQPHCPVSYAAVFQGG